MWNSSIALGIVLVIFVIHIGQFCSNVTKHVKIQIVIVQKLEHLTHQKMEMD